MQILLANDDGIHAPGLMSMAKELRHLGEVTVVAPAVEQSGVGHSITYRSPLQVDEVQLTDGFVGWKVHGSPADCVKLGILELCPSRPDLIISGINAGSNYGINVLYSGTVAAAIEGAFFGITSIAISLNVSAPPQFERVAAQSLKIIRDLQVRFPQPGLLWSINFPPCDQQVQGIEFTAMAARRHTESMEKRMDPRGKPYYWSSTDPLSHHHADVGTDVHALARNCVSVTPLMFDLTDQLRLKQTTNEE
ncbi:MAG: 5'/3'-nucleotidase SurE [Planctomycetaceae bacterium]|nr:5'/3'-nucleotidase SurE [Planctomycetaceae bacterium]